jgi:hypothetical protein
MPIEPGRECRRGELLVLGAITRRCVRRADAPFAGLRRARDGHVRRPGASLRVLRKSNSVYRDECSAYGDGPEIQQDQTLHRYAAWPAAQ